MVVVCVGMSGVRAIRGVGGSQNTTEFSSDALVKWDSPSLTVARAGTPRLRGLGLGLTPLAGKPSTLNP